MRGLADTKRRRPSSDSSQLWFLAPSKVPWMGIRNLWRDKKSRNLLQAPQKRPPRKWRQRRQRQQLRRRLKFSQNLQLRTSLRVMGIFKWHQKLLLSWGGGGSEREGTGHQMTNKGESKIAGGVFSGKSDWFRDWAEMKINARSYWKQVGGAKTMVQCDRSKNKVSLK